MGIPFTPEQEAEFHAGVQAGIEAADRGDFVDSAELWAELEQMLSSDASGGPTSEVITPEQ